MNANAKAALLAIVFMGLFVILSILAVKANLSPNPDTVAFVGTLVTFALYSVIHLMNDISERCI